MGATPEYRISKQIGSQAASRSMGECVGALLE